MARGPRPQRNAHEQNMPRADFMALEAWRQARCDRGDNSDDSTVANDNDDEDGGLAVQVGQDYPHLEEEMNEEVIEDTLEASIRHATTSMFMRILLFTRRCGISLR